MGPYSVLKVEARPLLHIHDIGRYVDQSVQGRPESGGLPPSEYE